MLRKAGLVEGRKNNLIISKKLAQKIDREAEYSKSKGFSKQFICDLILKALDEHGELTKAKIDELVMEYLPQHQTETQRKWKVSNYLSDLKEAGEIELSTGKIWRRTNKHEVYLKKHEAD